MERSGDLPGDHGDAFAMLMAYPQARLLQLTQSGLAPVRVEDTEHYRLMREFWADPDAFVRTVLET